MKVWITRAEPGAARTAERVRALGHEPLIAPLLQVLALPGAIDLDGIGALAFTSANGVGAFAERNPDRGLPVFAVGEASARVAIEAGFASVASADGDVGALARLIAASRDRFAGKVLSPGPSQPAGDLVAALEAQGVAARAQAVYETRAIAAPAALQALAELHAVLVHSPKAGAGLAQALSGRADIGHLDALCISPAAAATLVGLPFKGVRAAVHPDEPSLLALLPPAPPR